MSGGGLLLTPFTTPQLLSLQWEVSSLQHPQPFAAAPHGTLEAVPLLPAKDEKTRGSKAEVSDAPFPPAKDEKKAVAPVKKVKVVASVERRELEREQKREKKREKKRLKELKEQNERRNRSIKRLEKHFKTKFKLEPSNIEAVLAAAPTDMRFRNKETVIDLSILPLGDTIPLNKPLMCPFDCISFNGQFMLSVLVMTDRRDTPTICRFIRVPQEDMEVLMGPLGMQDPRESYLSPSLGAAARRALLKNTNGWTMFYVLVLHEGRTYRVALDRFRKSKGGPGFIERPGIHYTDEEIEEMCALAAKSHPSTSEYVAKQFFSHIHSMGAHSDRRCLPDFLETLLQVVPTVINPNPTTPVLYNNQWTLPPITPLLLPTFCHSSS